MVAENLISTINSQQRHATFSTPTAYSAHTPVSTLARQVLALMASGKSNREIAELLGLSEGTVKVHMTGIFKALGVSSRTQAMVVISRYQLKL